MKIMIYGEIHVEGIKDGQRRRMTWSVEGHISAPCLPRKDDEIWFLDEVYHGADPAIVTASATFNEIKPGIFQPKIYVDWQIKDLVPEDMALEGAVTLVERGILPSLTRRGWSFDDPREFPAD